MKLSEFETLSLAKAYNTTKGRMISPDMMVAFLATFKIGRAVEAEDSEAAFAFRKALQFGSEFNLMAGHSASVETLLNQMESANNDFKAYVIQYANPVVFPFVDTTQAQFNATKGLFLTKPINFKAAKDIVITLNADLSERVSATVWRTEVGFQAENAGRNVYLQTAGKYRIDMAGKKSGNYSVRLPLLDADFSVELI